MFVNVDSLLFCLFLESLNALHINTVSLQRGYSDDIAIYIYDYKGYDADPLGLIQKVEKSSLGAIYVLDLPSNLLTIINYNNFVVACKLLHSLLLLLPSPFNYFTSDFIFPYISVAPQFSLIMLLKVLSKLVRSQVNKSWPILLMRALHVSKSGPQLLHDNNKISTNRMICFRYL